MLFRDDNEFPIQNLRNVAGKADVLKMIHEYSDKKDEEFAIGTEGISDITAQHVDYVHSVINCETRNLFIDWFRYTFPEIILTDRGIDGDEPNIEWLVNQVRLPPRPAKKRETVTQGIWPDIVGHA